MTQIDKKPQECLNEIEIKNQTRDEQRLSTLKLWQRHLEALSSLEKNPLKNRNNRKPVSLNKAQTSRGPSLPH